MTLGGDFRTLTSLLTLWQNRCQPIGSGLTVVKVRPMQRIGFIAFPNFQVLSLCTVSVFECANILAPEPLYELHMLSEAGGTIRTSSGLALETKKFDDTEFDTLIVLGTLVDKPTFSPGLLSYVKNAPSRARRVASICTGALVLAEAGLLENRRVTTHWAYARYFRERFPNLNLEEDRIFSMARFGPRPGARPVSILHWPWSRKMRERNWLGRCQETWLCTIDVLVAKHNIPHCLSSSQSRTASRAL
jgi:DJ-1/PfpI family